MRCPSCRKNIHKVPDVKSIWNISEIELRVEKGKGQACFCVLCKNEFKRRNGTKEERHYGISVMVDDKKSCAVTVPPEMRYQLKTLLTKKRMNKELILRRSIIHNDCYKEYAKSSSKKLFGGSSGSRGYISSIGSNASGKWI